MNLRKQVEPLYSAALQASSPQRHAQRASSRLAWVKRWLRRASETITSKAGASCILARAGGRVKMCNYQTIMNLYENLVDELLQAPCPLVEVPVGG